MKKIYNAPETILKTVRPEKRILAGSVGVEHGDDLGNEFNSEDISYSRENTAWQTPRSLWDE